jgi:EmrB/QacA subfamily drug resistance transporter
VPPSIDPRIHDRRWRILAILCLSLFVIVVDTTITNVAIPSLANELDASTRQLQWIVDAYNLVFAGLLLAAGSLGDRYGRRLALVGGLAAFALTSALAATASSAAALILARGLMGAGAAFIFPATLALITSVFTVASERAKAIAIWTAVSGAGVAAGPITGGWLLDHFWWGSVFLVNVPVAVLGIVLALRYVPETRDRSVPRLDVVGAVLSVAAIGAIVWTIIEAPELGWTSLATLGGFTGGAALLGLFVVRELRVANPMLPVRIFRNLRFTAASVSVTAAFFALFGFIFLVTQYFQFVRGYTPLEAGVRTVPFALAVAVGSVLGARVVERVGTTRVVAAGLASMTLGFVWVSFSTPATSYGWIVLQMLLMGGGLGLTSAPATESIMGSLPVDKAGVGSAVNDTTRELGGTLGVAVVGSVFNSLYASSLAGSAIADQVPAPVTDAARESVGAAYAVAGSLGDAAGPWISTVQRAFMDGFGVACLVVAGVTAAGSLFALRFLPARVAESGPQDEPGRVDAVPA